MRITSKLKAYFDSRRAMRELAVLDDRTLNDLGVSRYNIRAAVQGRR